METNLLKNKVEQFKSIDEKMNMLELQDEIRTLLMKYSSGTDVQNLSVKQFKTVSHLLHDIILQPKLYLNDINNTPFRCPDCSADLEWEKQTETVKFIKHNI